jgi:hypothetical protein
MNKISNDTSCVSDFEFWSFGFGSNLGFRASDSYRPSLNVLLPLLAN